MENCCAHRSRGLRLGPTGGSLWIEYPDGSYTYVSNMLILVCIVFVICAVAALAISSSSTKGTELSATETAEYYDEEAARYRAMSRKLDAETDLAESVIKAKRTRAELDDIEEMFRDGKRRRRR